MLNLGRRPAGKADIYQDVCIPSENKGFSPTRRGGGGEIAQSLESLSIKWVAWVRYRLDLLVIEGWNSITVLLTRSHQCQRLVKKRQSMCYVCVIMHVEDP